MKRVVPVLLLAIVLTFALTAAAFAEHAPSNYSQWSTAVGTNAAVPSPHAGYSASTVKCSVCHSIHRSAVMGQNIRNQVGGAWMLSSESAPTEMLLRSSVEESCDYCHIETAAGGIRIYNGNPGNFHTTAAFDGGYGHHEACEGCHAVHGANTFKGALASKAIKYTQDQFTDAPNRNSVNQSIPGNLANSTYHNPITGEDVVVGIQDEIYTEGPASPFVDPLNKAQFATLADVIEGNAAGTKNDAVGADMKDLQVGAHCTTCHQTYAADSFQVVNPDQDVMLFGGTYGSNVRPLPAGGVPGYVEVPGQPYQSGTWKTKGHPVIKATADFEAEGSTLEAGTTVAYSDANTCRKCHDAGTNDAPAGVVFSSWPHVTPGYYRFMGAGPSADAYATYDVKQDMVADSTGWLAGDEDVTLADGSPSPNEAEGYMLYDGQNYKSDNPLNPSTSSHIGTDGLCLKCHVESDVAGSAKGVGYTF
ncbi:MAG TPA: hypothetical protein VLA05_04135 [Coriobacteriia bacterium]|nr:hypothetical protein [Coriobacteriia bacterium]